MAENPLLPNAELRSLLEHTRRCAALASAARRKTARPGFRIAPPLAREALVAATTLQLQAGDLLVPQAGDTLIAQLASTGAQTAAVPLLPAGKDASRLLLAAAMASALQQSRQTGTERLVLAFTAAAASEPAWEAALTWAQQSTLPLILACADARGPEAFRADTRAADHAFTWTAVQRTAARLKLPILSVDGEDAVAVYRVMQESVIRARAGGGPALLWAMLSPATSLASRSRSQTPVARLQQYLRSRKIPL